MGLTDLEKFIPKSIKRAIVAPIVFGLALSCAPIEEVSKTARAGMDNVGVNNKGSEGISAKTLSLEERKVLNLTGSKSIAELTQEEMSQLLAYYQGKGQTATSIEERENVLKRSKAVFDQWMKAQQEKANETYEAEAPQREAEQEERLKESLAIVKKYQVQGDGLSDADDKEEEIKSTSEFPYCGKVDKNLDNLVGQAVCYCRKKLGIPEQKKGKIAMILEVDKSGKLSLNASSVEGKDKRLHDCLKETLSYKKANNPPKVSCQATIWTVITGTGF